MSKVGVASESQDQANKTYTERDRNAALNNLLALTVKHRLFQPTMLLEQAASIVKGF